MPAMPDPGSEPKLICTPGIAVAALCVTLLLTVRRFGSIIAGHPDQSEWIYPINSWLPNWLAMAANIGTYSLFAWALIFIPPRLRGGERLIVAILLALVLISPLRQYLSPSLSTTVRWIQAFGNLIMFLASIRLYLEIVGQRS